MSFPKYPKYKDSGVEWLGEVPEHWDASRVRWLCQRYAGGTPDKTKTDYWENGTIPWLNSGAVNDRLITEPSALITDDAFANSSAKWIPRGSLLMALAGQGKTKGMVAQLGFPATCNQSMAALVPGSQVAARYLYYWLDSNYENIRNMAGGDLRDGLNLELIGDIPCPLPALPEQGAIANFLDRETAKIDALIAEQQRLIELLQEKRQAVISHAVTKGLNPNVPMKDSGIEWLGKVPAHWTMKRLKHVSPNLTVGIVVNPSTYVTGEGLPFIYGGDIREGVIDWENARRISLESSCFQSKTQLNAGDLLMVRVGAPGVTAVVPTECEGGNCASVMLIRQGAYSSQWLCYVLNTRIVRFQVEVVQYGAAQEQFNISHAVNFWLPVPPLEEQNLITAALDAETIRFDLLITEARRAITVFQERRSALISAAVTGQIDVRGTAGSEAA